MSCLSSVWTFKQIFPTECQFEKSINKKMNIKTVSLEKWDDCRNACRGIQGCHYFEHHQKTNTCNLLSVLYEKEENVVSGEDECEGKIPGCPDCFHACFPGEPFTSLFPWLCTNCNSKDTCTCATFCP